MESKGCHVGFSGRVIFSNTHYIYWIQRGYAQANKGYEPKDEERLEASLPGFLRTLALTALKAFKKEVVY